MTYRVNISDEGFVGTISARICTSGTEMQNPLLGSLKSPITWFEDQIRDLKYPVAVLSDITIDAPKKGHGRQTMRAFHHWASAQGAFFAFLRVGTQGDDYCTGVSWRRKFYKSEGWVSLRRPKLPHVTLHWMYRRLEPTIDSPPRSAISFERENMGIGLQLPIHQPK